MKPGDLVKPSAPFAHDVGIIVQICRPRGAWLKEAQILCLQSGADSIFYGDSLLTTSNPKIASDRELLSQAGVQVEWE